MLLEALALVEILVIGRLVGVGACLLCACRQCTVNNEMGRVGPSLAASQTAACWRKMHLVQQKPGKSMGFFPGCCLARCMPAGYAHLDSKKRKQGLRLSVLVLNRAT